MSFLLIANFKSHKTGKEIESWLQEVSPVVKDSPAIVSIAPSFPYLNSSDRSSAIHLAAQDVSPFPPGSYTGAINAKQLQDLGVTYCLIGHSERRRYFHETAIDVADKAKELIEVGITPILCLAKEDINAQRAALDEQVSKQCLFCYEPPADIGGTETASLDDIRTTTQEIKKIFSVEHVMYGGSVNADNIEPLLSLDLAGVLVASASLDSASFNQIIAKLKHVQV
jgi:triosephosphate isomerase